MEFGIARGPLLSILAESLGVGEDRQTAFLGKFQHFQRLSLIAGINPGRGKAAEYKAQHVAVIAIAFQISQLGLSPERTVYVMKLQKPELMKAIKIALGDKRKISECVISFDPAVLTIHDPSVTDDPAARVNWTFWAMKKKVFFGVLERLLKDGSPIARLSIINFGAVLRNICEAMDAHDAQNFIIGERSQAFLSSLREWAQTHDAEELL